MTNAAEKTTWAEVCKEVGFGENLYRTCRTKLGSDFKPADPLGDYDFEEDEDFDKQLRKTALPVPKPPASKKSKKTEPGFLDQLMTGNFDGLGGKIALWGGAAVVSAIVLKRVFDAMGKKDVRAKGILPSGQTS